MMMMMFALFPPFPSARSIILKPATLRPPLKPPSVIYYHWLIHITSSVNPVFHSLCHFAYANVYILHKILSHARPPPNWELYQIGRKSTLITPFMSSTFQFTIKMQAHSVSISIHYLFLSFLYWIDLETSEFRIVLNFINNWHPWKFLYS